MASDRQKLFDGLILQLLRFNIRALIDKVPAAVLDTLLESLVHILRLPTHSDAT